MWLVRLPGCWALVDSWLGWGDGWKCCRRDIHTGGPPQARLAQWRWRGSRQFRFV
jgi:hypothetical protein